MKINKTLAELLKEGYTKFDKNLMVKKEKDDVIMYLKIDENDYREYFYGNKSDWEDIYGENK